MAFLHDDQLAEVSSTPTAALSYAGTVSSIARHESSEQSSILWQPMRFRSFRRTSAAHAGVRGGRKLRPEDNSHKFHNLAVFAGRNVA
ncbi:hypothetical protein [Mycolicibacterium mucogenicum]|uniref:Uncharacterized protein n=1 Tax=Mycolicibacterium mucogenicum DSM 44124 TaxID=1226753 RepID=A0A8H2PFN5_MYCMU|nr:hypothetical protein [Mycolicibacterium mucogenicum]KAB7761837.1 hypothetical protein MMUC44124_03790 [Mycolicibacterium mucogenicum DSM 44124]QPG70485.1 hypothetical protein C1S78_005725 [Mycolicibacterium mucogenicum DSM 44124]